MVRLLVKVIHPIIMFFLHLQRKHKFIYLNQMPKINHNVIFAVNHGSRFDVPYTGMVTGKHFWILAGRQKLKFFDWLFFCLNGTIWVERKSKTERNNGKNEAEKLLKSGESLLIFPEGTWNVIPSLPMMPMAWGVIDLSMKTGCPILPIIIEYDKNLCYVNYGELMYCGANDDKGEKITHLRDRMSTLRWNIWEAYFKSDRADISPDEWENEVKARVEDYPELNFEYEKSLIRRNVGVVTYDEAFAHLDSLIPCKENTFLLNRKLKG